ncbi:hypothetical protein RvY_18750 [Ramazzottius varieornatus]|uniref:Vesicle transport protein n=1 Tax=Ramazzottius varieornatus TaxID=947166 RepID=A0A1D1W9W3_RAMVA|nr:hypothetical protein RvY_18750 [Ramazzottius varieornatus]
MEKMKKQLKMGGTKEKGLGEQLDEASMLSYKKRLAAFCVCYVLGVLCSLFGCCALWIPQQGLLLFAALYTGGNLISLASTCFLKGPLKQLKEMFAETRWIATLLMFLFMGLTLMAALWLKNFVLVVVFCACQYLALTWYSLSYIPMARKFVKDRIESLAG